MIKRWLKMGLLLAVLSSAGQALAVDALSASVARWPNTDVWGGRVAARWYWDWSACPSCWVDLTGFWDSSFAHYRSYKSNVRGDMIFIWAFSPVFRIIFWPNIDTPVHLFLDGGVGGSYVSQTRFANRNLSSHLLFEDRVGFGTTLGKHMELLFHYRHYSNANIVKPNEGLDIYTGTVVWRF